MPQNRFLIKQIFEVGQKVPLCQEDLHYFRKVLRGASGDKIELINGQGSLALASVEHVAKEAVTCQITSVTQKAPDPFHITLALAFLKPNHLEYALEKATEVGASRFFLFRADRSEKKELSDTYYKRLCTIAKSATKQCGRLYLPEIVIKNDLAACFEEESSFFYGDFGDNTVDVHAIELSHDTKCIVAVGPESGFSDKEKAQMQARSVQGISFHPNILRAETAAACSVLLLYKQCVSFANLKTQFPSGLYTQTR